MVTDEVLRQAAWEACMKMNDHLPKPEDCQHDFSKRFLRKMKKLLFRADHPALCRVLRSAACVALVLLLGFGSVLCVSAEARAAVMDWVRQQYESFYEYVFPGTGGTSEPKHYQPGWMPEGYELVTSIEDETGVDYVYCDSEGQMAVFSYYFDPESLKLYIESVEGEYREVEVNGFRAELYLAKDDSSAGDLIWIDENTGIVFCVSAPGGEEVLLKIAENIVEK